ncbi:MAG: hypothetical protein MJZ33_07905 [Paludibacteraceae bacterium]|nr:hypothetical protein [Paludibacteraceae bacterium]
MASEKKMCQIRDAYEANKDKEGVTISKICKQSGVPIAEYVEWLTLQAKPKLVPVDEKGAKVYAEWLGRPSEIYRGWQLRY